jgi:Fic family protein
MQPDQFPDAQGVLQKDPTGYWFFVPRPLPPSVDPTWELTRRLSKADRSLSELAGLARNLPNPHLLIHPFIRREAVLSSRIEGTQASLSDLFYFEAAETAPVSAPDVREVFNYVRALEHGLQRLATLPVSLRLIREIHGKLMEGVRGDFHTPGEFRASQNWIGPPGCTLMEAAFVPPRIPEMQEALAAFEKYLHAESEFPPLVRQALVHYQFEAIHPFLDGNGRVGRLLIQLLLCHDDVLPAPLLYVSAFFEKNRDEYYRRLLGVSQRSDWTAWIDFFLDGVAQQAQDAVWRTGRLLELWREYRDRVTLAHASATVLKLVDRLFESPVVAISMAAKNLGVTHRTATITVRKLVEANILQELPGRRRNRLYAAAGIMEVIERSRPDTGD